MSQILVWQLPCLSPYFRRPCNGVPIIFGVNVSKIHFTFQWVTFVMMVQAGAFMLPYKLWKALEGVFGLLRALSFIGWLG